MLRQIKSRFKNASVRNALLVITFKKNNRENHP